MPQETHLAATFCQNLSLSKAAGSLAAISCLSILRVTFFFAASLTAVAFPRLLCWRCLRPGHQTAAFIGHFFDDKGIADVGQHNIDIGGLVRAEPSDVQKQLS